MVNHTFLIDTGCWDLEGYWIDSAGVSLPIKGQTAIAWGNDHWFSMVSKLSFPESAPEHSEASSLAAITMRYRGRFHEQHLNQYTFILQHSQLGRSEGEGWIGPNSIVQHFWVLNDRDHRSGFETLYRIERDRYHLSSSLLSGHYLLNTMEASLTRFRE